MTSSPSYITKNRLGIYCFQYAIPSIIVKTGQNQLKQLFRKSLHTRNRREALKQARFLWLIMDKLADKYFKDPVTYGKAMELLKLYDSFVNCDWAIIEEHIFDGLESESEMLLLESALKMRIEQSSINAEQLSKNAQQQDLLNEYKNLLDFAKSLQTGVTPVIYSEKNNPKISFLIQKWLEVRRGSGIKIDSISSLEQRIDIFLKIITELNGSEPTGSELTSNLIREYYELLKKVPAYRKANNLVGKSFIQLSKLGLKPISDKTYAEYTSVVSDFLRWSEGDGYPVNKELAGILKNSKTKGNKKNKKLNSILALPFDDNDLMLIFNNESYLKGSIDRASDYWVPLIALFTGARLGEICQLYLSDIRQEEGVWVIDINDERDDDDEDKSIKSEGGSKRLVPIHKELIKLGLLTYGDLLLKAKETRLFPDEKRTPLGKFDAISKRFSYKIGYIGVKDNLGLNKRKSFHSFRHTVRTRLVDANVPDGVIDSIIGHTSDNRSTGDKHYTHTQRITQKVKALDNLSYDVNLRLIKKWDECKFGRIARRTNSNK